MSAKLDQTYHTTAWGIALADLDRRNHPVLGWFLEANLGPRCPISSFFPNRLPSISQCSKNVDEPHFFGALFPHCEAEGRRFGKNEARQFDPHVNLTCGWKIE